ncbi:MAG: hypothetical protein PUA93_01275 [Eubacteriales bacterium]|nr:hypothetical protein [Eubacteriales bacterium]
MKRKSASLLLLFLLLSSCRGTEASSLPGDSSLPSVPVISSPVDSSSSSSNSSSSSSSAPAIQTLNKKILAERFLNLAQSSSFTVALDYLNGNTFTEIYSDKYIYQESTNEGLLLRKDLLGTEKTCYSFEKKDGKVVLHSQKSSLLPDGSVHRKDSLEEENPFYRIRDSIQADLFLKDETGYYSSDFDLVLSLSYAMNLGFYGEEGQYADATFALDEGNNLIATLQVVNGDGYLEDYAKATFLNIDQTIDPEIEAFLSKEIPLSSPSEEAFATLISPHTMVNDIGYITESIDYRTDLDKLTLSAGEEKTEICLGDRNLVSSVSHLYEKGEDGKALSVYLSATNTVEKAPLGVDYSSVSPRLKNLVHREDFFLQSDGSYRYLGLEPEEVYRALGYADLGEVDTLDFTLRNNAFVQASTSFTTILSSGFEIHYVTDTSLDPFLEPSIPEPSEADSDTALIQEKIDQMNLLSDSVKNYTVKTYEQGGNSDKYYTLKKISSDLVLKEKYTSEGGDPDKTKVLSSGYGKNSNGHFVHFAKLADGSVRQLEDASTDLTLRDLIHFDVAPELLKAKKEADGSRTLTLKQRVADLGEHIPGGRHASSLVPSRFSMKLDKTHSDIESLSYRYSELDGKLTGTEVSEFSGYNSTTFEESLRTAVASLPDKAGPLSFDVEENAYPSLITFLGEENAKKIPYLFDNTLYGKWVSAIFKKNGDIHSTLYLYVYDDGNELGWSLSEDPIHYMERYKALLDNSPSLTKEKDGFGNDVYLPSDRSFAISLRGKGPQEGLSITIPE